VLKIEYRAYYRSYYAIANEAGKILIYAYDLLVSEDEATTGDGDIVG